jgi:hypothetical protein
METSPYTIEELRAACERGAATLEREATDCEPDQPGRARGKREAAGTIRRWAEELLIEPLGEGVPGAAILVGWAGEMGGILIAGNNGRPMVEQATLRGLVAAGYMEHVADPGQVPFYALAGYMEHTERPSRSN